MTEILLVGCGNMGHALMRGWVAAGIRVQVVEPNDALRQRAAQDGAVAVASADALGTVAPDLVVLAVKPQVMGSILADYAHLDPAAFVSVAAGTMIGDLRAGLGSKPVIRVMPNTPAAVGAGMLVCCAGPDVSERARMLTDQAMAASGKVAWIADEALMDAVTAISGSGPAYVFHMIECLSAAGAALGLPKDVAALLAMQTVHGAGLYAAQSADTPGQLRQQVTSPGGTTQAGLEVLMGGDALKELMARATTAARDRGAELGKS